MNLVGHGATGLRDNQRTFYDLVDESASGRTSLLELAPGLVIPPGTWGRYEGNAYRAPVRTVVDGVLRDIVSVDTSVAPSALVRVETSAECIATPGTYFYDYDAAALEDPGAYVPAWDDGVSLFDSGLWLWDQMPAPLWVHLPDGSNPELGTVVAGLGFYYSSRGEVHPRLGPEKFVDADCEDWSDPTHLVEWNEVPGTGWTVNQEAAVVRSGLYSVRLEAAGAGPATQATARQQVATVVGKLYVFSGYYMTDPTNDPGIVARIRVRNAGATGFLDRDGRSVWGSENTLTLADTSGDWRRFHFCLVAFHANTVPLFMAANVGTAHASGKVYFDRVSFRRVYGFWYYEPRLGAASVPETESAKAAVFFGGKAVGLGQASLLNGDGALYTAFGMLELLNRPAALFDGGTFADGQELLRDDYRPGFLGYTRDLEVDDKVARLALEDQWTFSQDPLPPRLYSRTQFANMQGDADGKARPLLFGERSFYESEGDTFKMAGPIVPVRIDRDVETGYGVYEICDPTNAPGPIEPFPG